jgi:hypothetical protein
MRGASLRDCARHHGRHGNPIADATATCRRRGQNRTSYQTPSQRCPGPRNSRHSGDSHRHNRRTRRGARRSCIPRPEWSNETYIFGYPPISTLDTPYLLVQRGAVVNPAVKSQQDEHFFLYSAIARPGNSGGPLRPPFLGRRDSSESPWYERTLARITMGCIRWNPFRQVRLA